MEEKLNAKLQKRSADLDTEATSTLSSSIAELSDLETRVRDCRETLDKVHETFSKSDCNAEQVLSDTLSGVRSTSRVIDGLKKNYHNLEKGWEALERERRTFREERAALEMKMAMPIGMDEESVVKMHSEIDKMLAEMN
jgi:chromosome segregation ATPase